MSRIKLIFNPMANLRRAWPVAEALRPIVDEFGGADWAGTVYPTHATQVAVQAARDGYDTVVAMGGDGTVHEVINGLMQLPAEQRPKLGIVPVGSGNDFAHSLGISKTPETALRQMFAGQPRPIDVARLQDNLGRCEYFVNTMGIGIDALVNIRSRQMTWAHGFFIYLLAALQTIALNYHPYPARLSMDGAPARALDILLLALCNGRREGGGFDMAPQAKPDDGRLEYVLAGRMSRLRMLLTLPRLMNGTHTSLDYIKMGAFQRLELESTRPLHIHTDGEIFAGLRSQTTRISVELLPGAVTAIWGT